MATVAMAGPRPQTTTTMRLTLINAAVVAAKAPGEIIGEEVARDGILVRRTTGLHLATVVHPDPRQGIPAFLAAQPALLTAVELMGAVTEDRLAHLSSRAAICARNASCVLDFFFDILTMPPDLVTIKYALEALVALSL
jgi:hypothetical protein